MNTKPLTHIGLFEGIGGFSLAARAAGWETLAWCEIDPFCRAVLSYHFPEAEALSDIKTTDFTKYANKIDVLTGGFPCQPYSLAGKRLGTEDNRHLWPEMLRAIREIAPRWVVGENVYGIVNWNGGLVFNEVQADLEYEGYEVQAYLLPACSVDAPHQRYRVWFVAYRANAGTQSMRRQRENATHGPEAIAYALCAQREWTIRRMEPITFDGGDRTIADATFQGLHIGVRPEWRSNWEPFTTFKRCEPIGVYPAGRIGFTPDPNSSGRIQSDQRTGTKLQSNRALPDWRGFPTQQPICSRNDGFPTGLVRIAVRSRKGRRFISERQAKARLRREAIKACGNAIVPQVFYQIAKAINQYELNKPCI